MAAPINIKKIFTLVIVFTAGYIGYMWFSNNESIEIKKHLPVSLVPSNPPSSSPPLSLVESPAPIAAEVPASPIMQNFMDSHDIDTAQFKADMVENKKKETELESLDYDIKIAEKKQRLKFIQEHPEAAMVSSDPASQFNYPAAGQMPPSYTPSGLPGSGFTQGGQIIKPSDILDEQDVKGEGERCLRGAVLKYMVKGIITSGKKKAVVTDGKTTRVLVEGSVLHGYKLTDISTGKVVMSCKGDDINLFGVSNDTPPSQGGNQIPPTQGVNYPEPTQGGEMP